MRKKGYGIIVIIGFIVLIILAIFIVPALTGDSIFRDREDDPLPREICKLESLDLQEVDTAEGYKKFADNMNNFIKIINSQTGSSIQEFGSNWDETSKFITKYAPLIDNYNEVVLSAKQFNITKSKENYKIFYTNLSALSVEFAFITNPLFHKFIFSNVGKIYFNSGLSHYALKCPKCVSASLSTIYWTGKNFLAEELSREFEKLMVKLKDSVNLNSGKLTKITELKLNSQPKK